MSAGSDARSISAGWPAKNRYTAFGAHLTLSAAIVGGFCALTFFVWYPHPYFSASGTWSVLRILIGVDLVLGPLLTLIVFKPGKPGLKLDLGVIAAVQLVAFLYGASAIYRERPAFTVFAVDRFYVLARGDVVPEQLADESLMAAARIGARPARGPLLVAALVPKDPVASQRLLFGTVLEGKPDIERRPEFWTKYGDAVAGVLARARPVSALGRSGRDIQAKVGGLATRLGRPASQLGFLPLIARNHDLSMIVDLKDGQPLEVVDADPWVPSTAKSAQQASRRSASAHSASSARSNGPGSTGKGASATDP